MARNKIIFGTTLLLLLMISSLLAEEFSFEYQKILEIEKPITLTVDIARGDLIIAPSEDGRLKIDALKMIRASNKDEAEEVADHIEIKVEESGDDVRVRTNYLRILNRSTSFWKKVLGAGKDSFGEVKFNIALPPSCNLILNAGSGSVEVYDHKGSVQVTSGSMNHIKVHYNQGPISVACESADIDLQWIEGDIRVKSQTGPITIKQLMGAIDLKTGSSQVDIQTELMTDKNYYIETTSGKILFAVPLSAAGWLNIDTKAGEIRTDVPVAIKSMAHSHLEGEFGGGGTKITLTSLTGDVTVTQF